MLLTDCLWLQVGRWVLTAACGLLIGLTAFGMSKAIESIMSWKMQQLTARIKVDLMQRTGDVETTALSDGSGGHAESINDALNFDATQVSHLLIHQSPACVTDPSRRRRVMTFRLRRSAEIFTPATRTASGTTATRTRWAGARTA